MSALSMSPRPIAGICNSPAKPDLGHFDVPPLSVVAGRKLDRQLPETPRGAPSAATAQRGANGPLRTAGQRAPRGGRPATINSLWLWGAGVRPAANTSASASNFAGVWGEDVLTCGLGRAYGIPTQPLPDDLGGLLAQAPAGSRQLLVLDTLQRPVQYEDADAYASELARLDRRWFAPLQKALASGRIKQLRLEASTAYATAGLGKRPRRAVATVASPAAAGGHRAGAGQR
jgi:hypothetical protein